MAHISIQYVWKWNNGDNKIETKSSSCTWTDQIISLVISLSLVQICIHIKSIEEKECINKWAHCIHFHTITKTLWVCEWIKYNYNLQLETKCKSNVIQLITICTLASVMSVQFLLDFYQLNDCFDAVLIANH